MKTAPEYLAKVDLKKCFGCGNCVVSCPFNVIALKKINGDFKADVNHDSCTGCGTCVPSCWNGAMQQQELTDIQILDKIKIFSKSVMENSSLENKPGVLVFRCNNSFNGSGGGNSNGSKLSKNILTIDVPCTSRVRPEFAAKALAYGFAGILIMDCGVDECTFNAANDRTLKRFTAFKNLMGHLGFDPNRIKIEFISQSPHKDFLKITDSFISDLEDLGPDYSN